jgi:xylulokinase
MSLLGIDVGTTGCKAAIYSEGGQRLASAYEEYDVEHTQAGYAELDAGRVWETVKSLVRRVAAQTDSRLVQALAISSMGEAVVPVTRDRRILGPSLLNFDRRGETYLKDLQGKITSETLFQINGNTLGNQYSLTKLMWLKQHQPETYDQADYFLHWSGFIAFMLGAEPAVDYSLANRTLLFDLERQDWSAELVALSGLDGGKLPPPVASGVVIGKIASEVAQELGLPPRLVIVSGAHDQNANAIGCGVIDEGQAVFGMGTYICVTPVYGERKNAAQMLAQGLNTEHHAVPGRYVSFIYNQGGVLLKWYRDTFAAAEKQASAAAGRDLYAELISEIPEPPSGVLVLPHFIPTGPPDFIPDSSGVMVGLKLETTRGEILKGILEGSAFYLKECVDSLPAAGLRIRDFRAVGGGSKSDAWIQLSADIFGIPFVRPQVTEAGTLGAAILAGIGKGIFRNAQAGVETMVRLDRTFAPNPSQAKRYERPYAQYKQIWPLMREYLQNLSR